MTYSPAGSLNRFSTSRRLMKVFDFSLDLFVRKKFLLRWTFVWPENFFKQIKSYFSSGRSWRQISNMLLFLAWLKINTTEFWERIYNSVALCRCHWRGFVMVKLLMNCEGWCMLHRSSQVKVNKTFMLGHHVLDMSHNLEGMWQNILGLFRILKKYGWCYSSHPRHLESQGCLRVCLSANVACVC